MTRFLTLCALCFSLVTYSAYAIDLDIEPEHDAIIAPAAEAVDNTIENANTALSETADTIAPPAPSLQPIAPVAPVTNTVISDQPQTAEEFGPETRIFYARSVTSNNPEYKTRFSIIHNTPSPKRIGGERLYNLAENFFRLAVTGDQIEILDNPTFNLVGINSAEGRYGEIKFLDGARLNVHGPSKRFKGKWDLDGTGEGNLKITPTNLVSGVIPVHYKTFNADGTIVTDEKHDLYFKAMAMGPYNGYWSDGVDIGIYLWGMSAAKLDSKEMSYLGLDFGIVTHSSDEITGEVAEGLPAGLAPNAIASAGGASGAIIPFGGGNSYGGAAPFIGGVSGGFGLGFAGGGGGGVIGGGGDVINNQIINNGCIIGDVTIGGEGQNVTNNVTSNKGKVKCVADNDTDRFCMKNPTHPMCNKGEDDCEANPLAPGCEDFCTKHPTAASCCALHPERCDPVDPCANNPASLECNPSTPVSEPFIPLIFLSALIGFGFFKRKKM